jgi:predicted metal-dependent peptidase
MKELTGIDKLKQARARLMLSQPFYGSAATNLRLRENETCRTAWTDGRSLGFKPSYIDRLPLPICETLVAHEVLHNILLHPFRMRGLDHETANEAADYAINGILKRAGFPLKDSWLFDEELSAPGMSMESVYVILRKRKQSTGKGKGRPQDEPGTGGTGSGTGPDQKDKPEPGNEPQGGTPQDKQGNVDPAGQGKEQEQGPIQPWEEGEVRECPAEDGGEMSEAERTQAEASWKINGQRALAAGRAAGKVPAELARAITDAVVTKRDIEEILRDFIIKTLGGDYTYERPNKRHIIHDLYLPSIRVDIIPEIVMVMDTSGSIGRKELSYFAAKLNSVLAEYDTTVHIVWCDTACHDGGTYERQDMPIKLEPKGGGGTDFRPPFKWVVDKGIDPACLIYLTDGECNSFPDEPDFPVLWAIYGRERTVPWGEVVMITPEDVKE